MSAFSGKKKLPQFKVVQKKRKGIVLPHIKMPEGRGGRVVRLVNIIQGQTIPFFLHSHPFVLRSFWMPRWLPKLQLHTTPL